MPSLSEDFDHPLGRWNYYDTEPTLLDELKARKHTNLRSFFINALGFQLTMLALSQPIEDLEGQTMEDLEGFVQFGAEEPWSEGIIGPDPAVNNRNTLRVDVSGEVVATSALETGVDLRPYQSGDVLSMACPAFPGTSLDLAECSLTLEQGGFSVTLPFPTEATPDGEDREIAWPIEDLGEILVPDTVSLRLNGSGTVTVAALRMLAADWTPTQVDTDTITQRLVPIVDYDGSEPTTSFTKVWRAGEEPGEDDPRPINSRLTASFFSGSMMNYNRITLFMRGRREDFLTQLDLDGTDDGLWGSNQEKLDALGHQPTYGQAVYNPRAQMDLDAYIQGPPDQQALDERQQVEIERLPDTISEAWVEVTLYFGSTNQLSIETTETLRDDDFGYGFAVDDLQPNTSYLLSVDLEDNTLQATIYELSNAGAIGAIVFDITIEDGFTFLRSKGRIGWDFDLHDGDVYVESVRSRGLMFGEIQTNNLESFTPVDGARLVVGATPDREVVPGLASGGQADPTLSFNAATLALDTYNSRSADGAIKITAGNHQGFQSPLTPFEDFSHTYVSFDLFYPSSALADNALIDAILLSQYGLLTVLTMPLLKGDQWQTIRLRLTRAIEEQSGRYRLLLLQAGKPTTFWIDNLKFLFQSVAWSGRGTYNDPWDRDNNRWTEFQTYVNSENDGVVFPERGRWAQVRGQALTQEATIDKVYIRPKYSELGHLIWPPTYKRGGYAETEDDAIPKPLPPPSAYGVNSPAIVVPPNRIAINVSPSGEVTVGESGATLAFTGVILYEKIPIVEWLWYFGDGGTSTLRNPTHTYKAASPGITVHLRATDEQGNRAYASRILNLVKDEDDPPPPPPPPPIGPSVSLISPDDGEEFEEPADITIVAAAMDEDGTIEKIEFYEGSTKVGQNTTAHPHSGTPYRYSYNWFNVPAGTYTLKAKATDNEDMTKNSRAITIKVIGELPPIEITTPHEGDTFSPSDTIVIEAEVIE